MFSVLRLTGGSRACFCYRPVYAWPVISVVALFTAYLSLATVKSYQQRELLRNQHEQLLQTRAKHDEISRGLMARMKQHQPDAKASMRVITMLNPIAELLLPEVAIVNLQAEPEKKRVRLEVKAISLEALLDFSTRLAAIPAHVELQNHTPAKGNKQKWAVNGTLTVSFDDNSWR